MFLHCRHCVCGGDSGVCVCVCVWTSVHLCFIHLTKVYDSVDSAAMVAILWSCRVPQQLVEIIEDLYAGTWCRVRTTEGTSQDFEVKTDVRQGCVLSPILFNCFRDRILKEVAGTLGEGLQVENIYYCWRLVPYLL